MNKTLPLLNIYWLIVFVFTIQIISITELYYSSLFKGVGILLCVFSSYRTFPYVKRTRSHIRCIYTLLVLVPIYLAINNYIHHDNIGQKTLFYYINCVTLVNLFISGSTNDVLWGKVRLLSYFLYGLVLLNFITIQVYPNGVLNNVMYENGELWLLGHKNGMVRAFLPALALNIMASFHDKGKIQIKDIFLFVISLVSVVFVQSSTSILVLIFFGLQVCFIKQINKHTYYNLRNIYLLYLLLSILLVFYSVQTYLSGFFEDYLGKDASFSNRTLIWEIVIVNLAESPIWGLALNEGEEFAESIGLFAGATHSHNFMLWLLTQGGIVYISVYTAIVFFINKLISHKKNCECLILTIMFACYFMEGLTESITNSCLFFPLLALYIPLSQQNIYDE